MYSADVTSASRIYAYELSRGVGGVGGVGFKKPTPPTPPTPRR
ncbi:hypothetical protein [Spirosoma oryzicola]|nr:hypothetical protein [Spirosoma oryzicola]